MVLGYLKDNCLSLQVCGGLMSKKKKKKLLDRWPLKIVSFKAIICWMYLQNYQ